MYFGRTVTAVEHIPARQPLDNHDLDTMELIHVGHPLETHDVAITIDRLFASGMYDDVQVEAEERGSGVLVRIITRSKQFIGHVDAFGNISDPPSRSLILSTAQMNLGDPFDEDTLKRAKDAILESFRNNGLFEATIDARTITDAVTNQVFIALYVRHGTRAKYQMPIIQGDAKLSDATIVRATGWRVRFVHRWRQVTESLTDSGTDSLLKRYAKQNRLTATADVTSLDYDPEARRVTPTLQIEAGPKIAVKALEAKVSKSKLRQYVPVYQEGAVDNDLLTEGARNLQTYFQSKGYPDVDVTFKTLPLKNDEQVINYYIATGQKQKLAAVAIQGNKYFTSDTLHERMFLQPSSFVLRNGRYSEAFRKKDEEAIENLYQANGFRDVKVTSSVETSYKGKANSLAAAFTVYEGKQWTVSKVQIEGPAQLDVSQLVDRLASGAGQPYSDVNIATDRNHIIDYYYRNGFTNATFAYAALPGPTPQSVILIYRIREGRREYIRDILISGLNRTRRSLVERKMDFDNGEPLSLIKVSDVARDLSNLGVFAKVNTALQDPNGTNQYKHVLFDFDEAARYTVNLGLGAEIGQFGGTTQDLQRAGGKSGFYPRVQLDISRLNFLGIGQTITLQTRYSNLQQRASLSYTVPRFLGSSDRTVIFSLLYDTTQDVATFSSKRQQASVQTSQRLSKATTVLLRFDYRRVSTGSVVIPSLLVPQLLQPVRIGILSTSLIQDRRDNSADAHHGFWNTLDTGIAGGFFGSQRSFLRALGRNSTYTQITRNLVLARQTEFGVIVPFSIDKGLTTVDAVPLPEKFYGGGAVSMRGFGYNEAGPRDIGAPSQAGGSPSPATGFPLGGNALFFNNVELRFPLLGANISGVFFHDMGNVYRNLNDISFRYSQKTPTDPQKIQTDFDYAVQAVGFGIRYKTPLGPLRVDLAYALNPPRYNGFGGTYQELLNCSALNIVNGTNGCVSKPQQLTHFQFFFSIGQAF